MRGTLPLSLADESVDEVSISIGLRKWTTARVTA